MIKNFISLSPSKGHHGLPINEEKVKSFIETIERESSGQIRYAETSMRNGFGLKVKEGGTAELTRTVN